MAASSIAATVPQTTTPVSDPTGSMSRPWLYYMMAMQNRTGGTAGVDVTTVQTTANTALTNAAAAQTTATEAQTTANTAITNAAAAQTTATAAGTAAAAAQTAASAAAAASTAETTRALAAEALLAPKASPTFSGAPPVFALFPAYASDAAAEAGGIVVGQLYWSSTTTAVAQRRV